MVIADVGVSSTGPQAIVDLGVSSIGPQFVADVLCLPLVRWSLLMYCVLHWSAGHSMAGPFNYKIGICFPA